MHLINGELNWPEMYQTLSWLWKMVSWFLVENIEEKGTANSLDIKLVSNPFNELDRKSEWLWILTKDGFIFEVHDDGNILAECCIWLKIIIKQTNIE